MTALQPPSNRSVPAWLFHTALAAALYLADQLTKVLVLANLPYGEDIPVLGFFNLVHVTNTGAAFGMMQDSNLFFTWVKTAALVGLCLVLWRGWFTDHWSVLGLVLLFPGILGNLTDRLVHGHVIDFLDFHLGGRHWPSFNVADICICVAAGCLILGSFREEATKAASEKKG